MAQFQTPKQIISGNLGWILLIIIFGGLTVVTSINDPGNQFAQTYFVVWVMTIIGYVLSLLMPSVFEFVGVNKKNFNLQLLIGSAYGFILVGGLWLGKSTASLVPQLGSLVVPFSTGLGFLAFGPIQTVFLFGIFVAEVEESLFSSWFQPSAREWLSDRKLRKILLLLLGVFTSVYIEPFRIVGWVLLGIAIVDYFMNKFLGKEGISDIILSIKDFPFYVSLVLKGIFFAVVHYYAATITGQDPTLFMISAFIFAVLGGLLNNIFKSTIPSKLAHSINNTTIMSLAVNFPVWASGFFIVGYMVVLMIVYDIPLLNFLKLDFRPVTKAIGI